MDLLYPDHGPFQLRELHSCGQCNKRGGLETSPLPQPLEELLLPVGRTPVQSFVSPYFKNLLDILHSLSL